MESFLGSLCDNSGLWNNPRNLTIVNATEGLDHKMRVAVDKAISLWRLVDALAAQINTIAVTPVHALNAENPHVLYVASTRRTVTVTIKTLAKRAYENKCTY